MSSVLIIIFVIVALVALIVFAVRKGLISRTPGSFTGMSVYHDWINQDAQRGVEEIVKHNAGEKEAEDESGDAPFSIR